MTFTSEAAQCIVASAELTRIVDTLVDVDAMLPVRAYAVPGIADAAEGALGVEAFPMFAHTF